MLDNISIKEITSNPKPNTFETMRLIGSAIIEFDGSMTVEFLQEAAATAPSSFGAYRFNDANRINAITAITTKTENP